jgi:hypothetical protein
MPVRPVQRAAEDRATYQPFASQAILQARGRTGTPNQCYPQSAEFDVAIGRRGMVDPIFSACCFRCLDLFKDVCHTPHP